MRSAQEIWEAALGELQLQVNKPNYRTWFQGTKGIAYEDGRFTVAVPNTFIAEYLDRNQRSLIEKTLIGRAGRAWAVRRNRRKPPRTKTASASTRSIPSKPSSSAHLTAWLTPPPWGWRKTPADATTRCSSSAAPA
jgi:chromosomal replication initiation ATPase DnaA